MNPITKKFSQEEHNAIIDAIHATLEDTARHAEYGKGTRFAKVLASKLPANYRVSCGRDRIEVWQRNEGGSNNYDHRVALFLSGTPGQTKRDVILQELHRCDTRDFAERREQEKTIVSSLVLYEAKIERALMLVEQFRKDAAWLIKGLPVPKSATVRSSLVYWQEPSPELCNQFPNIFPK